MSPRAASRAPSNSGADPAPATTPPPWRKTTTGRRAAPSTAGVQTLSDRQSSPMVTRRFARRSGLMSCGGIGPNRAASRSPDHDFTGAGERQRRSPTGGAAYGTPRNATTGPARSPRRAPDEVRATSTSATVGQRVLRAHLAAQDLPQEVAALE